MEPSLVFLVGLPRSGTKLLRDLLNHHEDVAIFPHETHFFPPLNIDLQAYGDVRRWKSFEALYNHFKDAPFFSRMAERGLVISAEAWHRELSGTAFSDVLRALFAAYSRMTGCPMVGDKTPSYITQLPLLGSAFPDARFVHIIRDPRDYALSIRKAWGKDAQRATQRWKEGIRKCRSDASDFSLSYLEVRYEDLISDPRSVLAVVCRHLGITFSEALLVFEQPTENIGDARGALTVVRDNVGKWRRQLKVDEIRKLESIAGVLMNELGYPVLYEAGDFNVGPLRMKIGQVRDTASLFFYTIKEERGVFAGIRHMRRVARFK